MPEDLLEALSNLSRGSQNRFDHQARGQLYLVDSDDVEGVSHGNGELVSRFVDGAKRVPEGDAIGNQFCDNRINEIGGQVEKRNLQLSP